MRSKYPESEFTYIEIDFPDVCAEKTQRFVDNPELSSLIPGQITPGQEIFTLTYKLLHGDLRAAASIEEKLRGVALKEAPTLIISECVFAYIEAELVDELMERLARLFDHCAVVVYDIIGPNDAFGKTMMSNLAMRGILLKGVYKYPSVDEQIRRYGKWMDRVQAFNMLDVYRKCVDVEERRRIERIEIMDEFEEWDLLLKHYVIVLACKGQIFLDLNH